MRKVPSASFIYYTPKHVINLQSNFHNQIPDLNNSYLFSTRIRNSSNHRSRQLKVNRSQLNSSHSMRSLVPQMSNDVLYEETLSMKQQVNHLIKQISLIKSHIRKKDADLLLKEKIIEEANINAFTNQEKFDKLIDSNNINKIKKSFGILKAVYQKQRDMNNYYRQLVRYSKLNEIQINNINLESCLMNLFQDYSAIQTDNIYLQNELDEYALLPMTFSNQHQKISLYQTQLEDFKRSVKTVQIKQNALNEEIVLNQNAIKKLHYEKTVLIKQNRKLMNEQKNNESSLKLEPSYSSKIEEIEQQLQYYKQQTQKNDAIIKDLKSESTRLEKSKKKDNNTVLKPVNHRKFGLIESNPNIYSNSKLLLIKSLINESHQKQKRLHLKINASILLLKEFDIPVESIDDINNQLDKMTEKVAVLEVKDQVKQEIPKDNSGEIKEERKADIPIEIKEEIKKEITKENSQDTKEEVKYELPNNNFLENPQETSLKASIEIMTKTHDNINVSTPLVNNDTKDTSQPQIDQLISSELFTEITYVIIKNYEAKKIDPNIAETKVLNCITGDTLLLNKDSYINQLTNNIKQSLDCQSENDIKKIKSWLESLFAIYHDDIAKVTESFLTLFGNIKKYTEDEELIYNKKIKKILLPYKEKLMSKFPIIEGNSNGIISFLLLKNFLEEEKVDLKDTYGEYLFYKLKQFKNPGQASLYDLDLKLLYDIFDNNLNDSKMNIKTENDIEISQDDYVRIVTQFVLALKDYLSKNNKTIRQFLANSMYSIDSKPNEPGFDVINIELFVDELRKIKIEVNTELEIYCIFNRYKISDDYEYLSIDFIENDLIGMSIANKFENSTKQVMENVPEEDESMENRNE